MLRPLVCMSLFAMGILTMMSAHLRIAADENSPGGNPALSWTEIAGDPIDVADKVCDMDTTPCIEKTCYRWDYVKDNNQFRSFERLDPYKFGYCKPPSPPQTGVSCKQNPTVLCADVGLWSGIGCNGPYDDIAKIYVKDACGKQKVQNPPIN